MPQKGHKTIMVSEMVYDCAKKLAMARTKALQVKLLRL